MDIESHRKIYNTISMVIPTLNPGSAFKAIIDSILSQTMVPDEIIIVDSSSDDGSIDFVILMTQDALLYDKYSIEHLVDAITRDDRIGVVGGRQIAYPDAKKAEKLIREFNYPDKSSVWDKSSIRELGIKAFMISDVFAIYRKSAYLECGGFDYPILTNEDMLMAQKFLDHGYEVGYEASACVYHSHDNSLRQEYVRNRNIGYTLETFKGRFDSVSEIGRGFDLVGYVSKQLLSGLHFYSFVTFGFNCVVRFLGNRAGRKLARRKSQ